MAGGPFMLFPRDAQEQANRELVGPFYVGMILNYLFWGIQMAQTYYYYVFYRKTDRMWIKAGVATLFILDMFQSVCATQGVWHFIVDGWGNPNPVITPFSPAFLLITIGDVLTASTVHALYAQKIWVLLRSPYNYICTALVLFLSLGQLAGGIGCTALAFAIDITLVNFGRIKNYSIIWVVSASLCDIVIVTVMSWSLSRKRTGFKRTDDIITRLIRSTVETGLAPAVIQVADLAVFLIWPMKSYHVTFTLLNPKVYCNSMMALLNSRRSSSKGDGSWTSSNSTQDVPIDGIHIRAQTINVTDYELDSQAKMNLQRRL